MAKTNYGVMGTLQQGTSISAAATPSPGAARAAQPRVPDKKTPDDKGAPAESKKPKLSMPSDEVITRFVGASLGGAVLGSSYASIPMVGALLGALVGVGVVAFHTLHAAH